MHTPDPVNLLHTVSSHLRPGGLMVFQDSDFSYPPTMFPPSELSAKVQRWSVPNMQALPAAVGMTMGTRLYQAYIEAGLPGPELRLEAPVGGGPDWPGYVYVAETLRSLMPMLERMTGLDPDEVQIDTLAERMREDALSGGRIQMLPIVIGAWARKSA
jgi:hypothetical protein